MSIVIFSASTSWLTGLINLLLYHAGFSPLPLELYTILVPIGLGLTFPGLVYLCISIVKEEWVKYFMYVSGLLALIYYFINLVLYPLGFLKTTDLIKVVEGSDARFPDGTFQGYNFFYSGLTIATGVIFGIIILYIGIKTKIDFVKYRGYFMGIGLLMFAGFATLDALYQFSLGELWLLILTRFAVLMGMIFLSIGVTMPAFLLVRIHTKPPE